MTGFLVDAPVEGVSYNSSPSSVRTLATTMSIDFDQSTSTFETAVSSNITALTSQLSIGSTSLRSAALAVSHFQDTVTSSQSTDNKISAIENAPTGISLTSTTIAETTSTAATVGTFSTTDPDSGDSHTYSLVSGTGSDDNSSFSIDGSTLKTAIATDYDYNNKYHHHLCPN
ncbi:MAG: cadherin repeat domain-containing protein [SAR324 cluster bacterium]|nr:cadherin repeat domain-containing protein [SAR324 cluster bacterium]